MGGYFLRHRNRNESKGSDERVDVASRERHGTDGRFDRLVRALPLGVILLNSRGRITFTNSAAEHIFSFNPERILGRTIIEAVPSVELEQRVSNARS